MHVFQHRCCISPSNFPCHHHQRHSHHHKIYRSARNVQPPLRRRRLNHITLLWHHNPQHHQSTQPYEPHRKSLLLCPGFRPTNSWTEAYMSLSVWITANITTLHQLLDAKDTSERVSRYNHVAHAPGSPNSDTDALLSGIAELISWPNGSNVKINITLRGVHETSRTVVVLFREVEKVGKVVRLENKDRKERWDRGTSVRKIGWSRWAEPN